jgi:hypothetical protein
MPALELILTTAGKAAIVNANNTGTNPVVIDRVAIGSASWTPTAAATALNTEIKKITAIGGGTVADDTIHVTATDSTTDVYTVKEIGLYTDDDVLLAVYSQSTAIITKGAATVALLAVDLVITGIPAGSVTVGDTTFNYPQATQTVKGVAEIATTAEAQAGTDDERIITPKKLQDVTATDTRKGVIELATTAEAEAGSDNSRAVTPAKLFDALALFGLPNCKVIAGGTNLNSIAVTGFYRGESASTYVNRPALEVSGSLAYDFEMVHLQAGTSAAQIIFGTSASGQHFVRTKEGGTWQAWNNLVVSSRAATTTLEGIIELATNAEVQAGTDAVRAVTPASLNACTATTTRTGVIELATDAEVQAGSDATRAVTPSTLNSCSATTTRPGVIELATSTETNTGTDAVRAVTPNTLRLYPGTARAWVNFDGVGTVSINNSHGVSSITDLGPGLYQINWDGVFGSSTYAWVGTARSSTDGASDHAVLSALATQTKSTSALRIRVSYDDGGVQDSPEISVVAFA